MNLLWKLNDVSLSGRKSPRLNGVSVEIPDGVTAVLGSSGAGKTSLLNVLVGFERPSAGQVDCQIRELNGRLKLFWSPPGYGLWPHLTVYDHLSTVRPEGNADPAGVDSLLAAFGLSHLRDARPGSLSLGERSRLSVARALASDARVLVLDEPLAHVDVGRVGSYWSAGREYCAARNISVVLATHSPEVVLREASHVICLTDGQVTYAGGTDQLYERPQSAEQAAMLGPGNWFSGDDATCWFSATPDRLPQSPPFCVRPERLSIQSSPDGIATVEATRFAGAIAEVDLLQTQHGARRTFLHRPAGPSLRPGDRVLMVLLTLLLMLLLPGCESGEPTLQVKKETCWNMPPDGPRVPAPRGMTVSPDGEYLVLDNAGRLLIFDETGELRRQWWMPDYSVGKPEGVCVLKDGRIAVADTHYHRVVLFDHDGKVIGMFGKLGSGPGEFVYPVAVVQDEDENLYVCEYGNFNDRAQKFSKDGTFIRQIGAYGTEDGQFQRPSGAAWFDGRLYVVDAFNNRIQVFDGDGKLVAILGTSDKISDLYYPYDISVSERGELYVVEYGAGRVSKYDRSGKLLGRYGHTGPGTAEFLTPWGLAIDRRGRLYVCDTGNRRIVELEF